MPYKVKGKCVYLKSTGTKVGCTQGSVKKYLAALNANVKDIKESEEFEWVKDIPMNLGFDDLKVGDIVKLKDYGKDSWEVVEIYFHPKYRGEWSEKRIKFKRTKGNSYLELWKSPLNSEDYFELVNRKIFESEEDEFEWAKETVKDSFLKYMGKEIMIDIQGLNQDELKKLYSIILPYINDRSIFINDEGEEIHWGDNLQCFKEVVDGSLKKKSISLHCGIEGNEYKPLKGAICCLGTTYEDEPNKENIIPINARELIGGKINESEEWFEDVISDPIMLKVEDLEMGDIVIPTCVKEEEYIVNGKGTSVKLLHEPTHWVTLKRNTNVNTGGVFIEHDSEIGKNCRFKLVHRENIIEESEENDFSWIEDVTKYLKVGQKFKVKTSAEPLIVQIVRIVKKIDVNKNTIYISPINLVNTKYPGVPMNVQRLMTHINNGNWTPIDGITESEEDSELFWAEDLLKDTLNSVDITNKFEEIKMLPIGSVLKISGVQDEMELENLECQLIDRNHSHSPTYFLFKFKNEMYSGGDEPTHCGNKPEHKKICECRDDEDAPEGQIGKCWWVDLEYMEKVIYYPKRLGLVEHNAKKPLLTEGRYDAITRKVVKDIMKAVTDGDSDSYNLPWDISNEQEYEQEGLNFSLELDIVRTDDVKTFEVMTAVADDNDENIILMTISLNPNFSSQHLEKLFYKLQEDIRHEIEHLTQMGPNRIEDRPIYKGSTTNLKTVYGHHKNVIEVPALVHGFYRRAKLEGKPLDEVMMEDLDSEIEKGLLTKNQAQKLLTIWLDYAKKNLPKAKYST